MLANRTGRVLKKKSNLARCTFSFQHCFGGAGADSGPGEVKLLSRVSGYRAQPPRPNRVLRVTDTRPRSEVIASGHTASNAPDLFRLRRPRAMSRSPRLVRVALDFIKSSARRPRQVSFAPVCIRHGRNLASRGCLRWGRGARGSPQAAAPDQDVIVCAHPTALAPRTRSRPQPAPA